MFKLPEAMRHSMDHEDIYHSMDNTNMIVYNCMQEVLAVDPFEEYLGKLSNEKEANKQDSPREHSEEVQLEEGIIFSRKEKVKEKRPPLRKSKWKKVDQSKKDNRTSTLNKVTKALMINQGEQAIHSSLGFDLFGDNFRGKTKEGLHLFKPS